MIVNGRNISKMGEDQLAAWRTRNVGYIFQSFNLVPVSPHMKTLNCRCCFFRLTVAAVTSKS